MKMRTYLTVVTLIQWGCTAESTRDVSNETASAESFTPEVIGGQRCPAIAVTCAPGFIQCTQESMTCQPVSMGEGPCRQTILCTPNTPIMNNPLPSMEDDTPDEACESVDLMCPEGQVRCLVATPACDTVTSGEGACRETIFCRDAPTPSAAGTSTEPASAGASLGGQIGDQSTGGLGLSGGHGMGGLIAGAMNDAPAGYAHSGGSSGGALAGGDPSAGLAADSPMEIDAGQRAHQAGMPVHGGAFPGGRAGDMGGVPRGGDAPISGIPNDPLTGGRQQLGGEAGHGGHSGGHRQQSDGLGGANGSGGGGTGG